MRLILKEHLISLISAISLVCIILLLINVVIMNSTESTTIISGKQSKLSSVYANFDGGDSIELELMASLLNKQQITLFGSSEFSNLSVDSYNFFPDSLGKQMLGFGHAHHQNLSILIELLAADDFNYKSDICIFISPGWFLDGKGTNTQAFVEFARPNFLASIEENATLKDKYKNYIGQYIDFNYESFLGAPIYYEKFRKYVTDLENPRLSRFRKFIEENVFPAYPKKIKYLPELTYIHKKKWKGDFDLLANKSQQEFINAIHNNKLYVNDEYFTTYLLGEKGENKEVFLESIDLKNNKELEDFKMLITYIKERKMNASFVILPLNPYYYKNTEILMPLIDSLTTTIAEADLHMLNLYVSDTSSYSPGVLKDIMHLGDYGWMKVNKFLYKTYLNE